jgi:hypothetical protein
MTSNRAPSLVSVLASIVGAAFVAGMILGFLTLHPPVR